MQREGAVYERGTGEIECAGMPEKGELAPFAGALPPSADTISDLICRELIAEAKNAADGLCAVFRFSGRSSATDGVQKDLYRLQY